MGISKEQALDCFASDDLIGIGMEADAVRRRLHPEGVVSYGLDGVIELEKHLADGMFALDAVCHEVAGMFDLGGSGVVLAGAPVVGIEALVGLLKGLKARFPEVRLHGLSSAVVVGCAAASGLEVEGVVRQLRDAGLDSISGAGLRVHRAAHGLGMKTTAAISFGAGETAEERVAVLEAIRGLQEETGGFTAFLPVAAAQRELSGGLEEATAVEYLKTLAIARMYLDNIENVQASLPRQGLKVLQMGLRFGSNDVGSVVVKGTAQRVAGLSLGATEEEVRRLIRDAGFVPVERDALFSTMYVA